MPIYIVVAIFRERACFCDWLPCRPNLAESSVDCDIAIFPEDDPKGRRLRRTVGPCSVLENSFGEAQISIGHMTFASFPHNYANYSIAPPAQPIRFGVDQRNESLSEVKL